MHVMKLYTTDSRQFLANLGRRAADMETVGGPAVGAVARVLLGEMEKFLAARDAELLTLDQAEKESGYSYDHLRKMIAAGTLPNHGRKGKPLVRRSELPKKPTSKKAPYDAAKDVADFLSTKRSAA